MSNETIESITPKPTGTPQSRRRLEKRAAKEAKKKKQTGTKRKDKRNPTRPK